MIPSHIPSHYERRLIQTKNGLLPIWVEPNPVLEEDHVFLPFGIVMAITIKPKFRIRFYRS